MQEPDRVLLQELARELVSASRAEQLEARLMEHSTLCWRMARSLA